MDKWDRWLCCTTQLQTLVGMAEFVNRLCFSSKPTLQAPNTIRPKAEMVTATGAVIAVIAIFS
jgi:hypothetical protein